MTANPEQASDNEAQNVALWLLMVISHGQTGMELDIIKILAIMQSCCIDIAGTLHCVWLSHCSLGFVYVPNLHCHIGLIIFLKNHLINVPSVLI